MKLWTFTFLDPFFVIRTYCRKLDSCFMIRYLAVVSTSKGKQDTNLKHSGPSPSHAAGGHHSNHTAQNSLDRGECPADGLTGVLRSLWLKLPSPADNKKAESCPSFPFHCHITKLIMIPEDGKTVFNITIVNFEPLSLVSIMFPLWHRTWWIKHNKIVKPEAPQVHSQALECSKSSASRANTVWPS